MNDERVLADTIRFRIGMHMQFLHEKYGVGYKDVQAVNDMAYEIVQVYEKGGSSNNG